MEPYENTDQGGKKTLWIIGGIIFVIMIIGIVYGATQRSLKKTDSDTIGQEPLMNQNNNQVLSRETAISSPATIDELSLANLGTFPYQVQAKITGDMANGCAIPDVMITRNNRTFTVDVVGLQDPDAMCTMVMTPFEKIVELPVAGLPAGTYTVKIGDISKTFTLASENRIQFIGDK